MKNQTKYPMIVIGIALVALVAINYTDLFTGQTIIKAAPKTFEQERTNLVRDVDVPSMVSNGDTVNVVIAANTRNDLIRTNKEKVVFYNVDTNRMKKQLTYPKCLDGRTSACNKAEKSYNIPMSWEEGAYVVQIERAGSFGEKYVTEIIGKTYFKII